jgi:hypothetical protein
VLWAAQDPAVDFLAQMSGGNPVVTMHPATVIAGELERWRHFFQWPKGAPLALLMLAGWAAAWFRSTRVDKTMATIIVLFALAMPFTTVNTTSRYLIGLIPFFGALMVRLGERIVGGAGATGAGHKVRWAMVLGGAGVYVVLCVGGIGLMFYRLRGADVTRVLDRVAEVVGPSGHVYGDLLLWMGQDRYRYGPFRTDHPWRQDSIEMVSQYRFEYAVRPAWTFGRSHGVSTPPAAMPAWRTGHMIDEVCRRYGTKIAEFRDPHYGPMEVYKLDWNQTE